MPLTCRVTIDFEVTVMVTLAAADMRIVYQSDTVGDEHEHSKNTSCDGKSHVSANLHKTAQKTKVTLIQETQYLLLPRY